MPVISFLLLKGKCRSCRGKISAIAVAIELVAALIGAIPLVVLPENQAVAAAVFGWALLPLILLDHFHLWLPNRLTIILAATGLLAAPMLTPEVTLTDRLAGMAVGFLSLEAIRQIYKRCRQQDGMGAGDPKLFGALGIWLGWQALPITLLMACAIGLVLIAFLNLTANHHRTALPFGSYLGIAAYAIVLIG